MPMNMMPRQTPITMSVDRAFFHSGGLNAGTPFEIASTPVMAAPPDANACRMRNNPTDDVCTRRAGSLGGIGSRWPVAWRTMPTMMITSIDTMKQYVGAAKMRPD